MGAAMAVCLGLPLSWAFLACISMSTPEPTDWRGRLMDWVVPLSPTVALGLLGFVGTVLVVGLSRRFRSGKKSD